MNPRDVIGDYFSDNFSAMMKAYENRKSPDVLKKIHCLNEMMRTYPVEINRQHENFHGGVGIVLDYYGSIRKVANSIASNIRNGKGFLGDLNDANLFRCEYEKIIAPFLKNIEYQIEASADLGEKYVMYYQGGILVNFWRDGLKERYGKSIDGKEFENFEKHIKRYINAFLNFEKEHIVDPEIKKLHTLMHKANSEKFNLEEDRFWLELSREFTGSEQKMVTDSVQQLIDIEGERSFLNVLKYIFSAEGNTILLEDMVLSCSPKHVDDLVLLFMQKIGGLAGRTKNLEGEFGDVVQKNYFYMYKQHLNKVSSLVTKHRINAQALAFSEWSGENCSEEGKELIRGNWLDSLKSMFNQRRNYDGDTDEVWDEAASIFLGADFGDECLVSEKILSQLSTLNRRERVDVKTGDFLVVRIEEITGDGYHLAVPNSNIHSKDVKLDKSYAPIELFQTNKNLYNAQEEKDLLLVQVKGNTSRGVLELTAKGPEYVGNVMHLFLPYANSWENAVPQRKYIQANRPEKIQYDWSGDLWMGGSNSATVVRLEPEIKSMYLSGGGWWGKVIQNILRIKRVVFFQKYVESEAGALGWMEEVDTQVKHFINDFYRDLRIHFEDDGSIVVRQPIDLVEKDEAKIRTFLAMFRKVFGRSIRMDEWDEDISPIRVKLARIHNKWPDCNRLSKYSIEHLNVDTVAIEQQEIVLALEGCIREIEKEPTIYSDMELETKMEKLGIYTVAT